MSPALMGATAQAAPNRPPTITAIANQVVTHGHAFTIRASAKDPDRGPRKLVFSVTGKPAWAKLNTATGALSGIAPVAAVGKTYPVTLRVTDGKASDTEAYTIRVKANAAPVLANVTDQNLRVDQAFTVRPKATDADGGPKPLAWTATFSGVRPSWVNLSATTGVITGTAPASAAGSSWTVTLKVSDGLKVATDTFKLSVLNDAPSLALVPTQNKAPGDIYSHQLVGADTDGPQAVTYVKDSGPSWLSLDTATGQVSGTVPAGTSGLVQAVFRAYDGNKYSVTRQLVVNVTPAPPTNSAPLIPAGQTFDVAEGPAGAQFGTVSGSDPDGDDLIWSITTSGVPFAIGANGKLSSNAALDFEAKDSYTFTVRASDGTDATTAEVTVDVTDVDESPVVAPVADITAAEDAPITPVTIRATDPEGKPVTLTVTDLPQGLTFDAAANAITGTPTVPGTSTVTVTAADGTGPAARSVDTVETFTITVTNVNDAPVIDDQAFSVAEGSVNGTVVGTLAATDEDGDDLAFSGGSAQFAVAGNGTVTVKDSAALVDGAGPFTFTATVSDDDTDADATVTVELVDVDNAPVAADKSFSVAENAAPGTSVGTATATDADGDAIRFAITGGNAGSVFAIDAATGAIAVAGSLDHETTGSYTLTVRATAGAKSDDATVTVTVTDVNEAPVLGAIADQDVTEDAAITPIQVTVTDPDQGDSATVTVTALPAGLTYNPSTRRIGGTPTVPGSSAVTVTATDGDLTASRTFTIVVANVNDKPVIAPVSDRNATEDTAIAPIVITASDEDGDTVTLSTSTLPTGLSFNAATGTISGTPTVAGSFLVTVTATDGKGGQATDDFTIVVAAVNDAPVITSISPSSLSGTEDEAFDEDVTVVAVDEDGDDLDLSVSGLPAGLTGTDNGDGTVTIAGTPTSAGAVTATITATDPDGESDAVDLTVTIAAAAETCSPISTLPCSDVLVGLPFDLTFDGTEDGLDSTGFTMVDPPSARNNTAQAPAPTTPTYPTVPGFEPSLVTAQGGTLSVQATKGIMFRFPGTGGSTETNSQLNALGVGVDGGAEGYEVESTVVAPTFPGAGDNSQQGGVWFGLDEDDYVKLAVVRATATTNKIQMLTEVGSLADPDTRYALNSATFPAGQDVRLVLRAEDTPGAGGTAAAFYSVGAGAPVRLTDVANTVSSTALPIPQRFFDGVEIGDDTASFAGVFTTKRRAAATDNVTVNFADFGVSEYVVPNVAPTLAAIGNVTATEGVAISPVTVTAQDADGDDLTISSDLAVNGLTLVDNGDGTATLSGTPATGTAAASPYQVTVTADDGEATATRTFTVAVSAPAAAVCPDHDRALRHRSGGAAALARLRRHRGRPQGHRLHAGRRPVAAHHHHACDRPGPGSGQPERDRHARLRARPADRRRRRAHHQRHQGHPVPCGRSEPGRDVAERPDQRARRRGEAHHRHRLRGGDHPGRPHLPVGERQQRLPAGRALVRPERGQLRQARRGPHRCHHQQGPDGHGGRRRRDAEQRRRAQLGHVRSRVRRPPGPHRRRRRRHRGHRCPGECVVRRRCWCPDGADRRGQHQ